MTLLAFFAGPVGRWLVIAAMLAAALFTAYHKGRQAQEAVDEVTIQKLQNAMDAAANHAGAVKVERDAALSTVGAAWETDRGKLSSYYAGKLRAAQAAASAGAVPADQVPAGTDAAKPDGVPAETAGCEVRYAELEGACALTTLQLHKLQEAAKAVETIN